MQRSGQKSSCLQEPPSCSTPGQSCHLRDRLQRSQGHELQGQEKHLEEVRMQSVCDHFRESDSMPSKWCHFLNNYSFFSYIKLALV
jgi:hypothetical protein